MHPIHAQAYSLIELLVATAIIILLIGLLMPALGIARATAHRVTCAGNLRQFGIANTAYAADHRYYLYGKKNPPDTSALSTNWYSNRDFAELMDAVRDGQPPYLPSIWQWRTDLLCPIANEGSSGSPGNNIHRSYGLLFFQGAVPPYTAWETPDFIWRYRPTQYAKPGLTAMFMDALDWNATPRTEWYGGENVTGTATWSAVRHRGQMNILYADMHVAGLAQRDVLAQASWLDDLWRIR